MKTSAKNLVHRAEFDRKARCLSDALTLVEKGEAIRREEILRRWDIAKRGGWEMGWTADAVTARFIIALQDRFGLIVSKSSLFNWERRYRSGGLSALVDRRSTLRKFKKAFGIEGGS